MRKLPSPAMDETPPRWKKTRRKIVVIVLGILFAPLIIEGSALCTVQWRAMYVPVAAAKTPILDTLGASADIVAVAISNTTYGVFHIVPLRPIIVIPFACAWALCSSVLLRRW